MFYCFQAIFHLYNAQSLSFFCFYMLVITQNCIVLNYLSSPGVMALYIKWPKLDKERIGRGMLSAPEVTFIFLQTIYWKKNRMLIL